MKSKIIPFWVLLFLCLLFFNKADAQKTEKPFFNSGDRVCFAGNSITHIGHFHHNISLYYVTRFPGQPVTFYNCGIGGDVAGSVLRRMDDDILVHQPTHAIIMLGMNDVKRWLYGLGPTTNADTLAMRQ